MKVNFGNSYFNKLLSHLSHKAHILLSSPVLLRKLVIQYMCAQMKKCRSKGKVNKNKTK